MDIVFGIISYKRCGSVKTINTLKKLNVPMDKVVLSTQTEDDYHKYNSTYGSDVKVIYKEGHSAADNRNTLLDYFGSDKNIILLDDDLEDLVILNSQGKLTSLDGKTFVKLIEYGFDTAKKTNSRIWGMYPLANNFYMSNGVKIRSLIVGAFIGIVKGSNIRFDNSYPCKDDYALSLKELSLGYNTLRLNNVSFKTKYYAKGGCEEVHDKDYIVGKRLIREYPQFVRENSKRPGEILIKHGV